MSLLATRHHKTTAISREDRILGFLRDHQTGVLATASRDGTPHASVIYYFVDSLFNAYFITKKLTTKANNLRLNNRAALSVYDDATQTVAEIHGEVVELRDPMEANQAFRNALRSSLHTAGNAIPPISKLAAGDYVSYKLVPGEVRMAVFNKRSSEQTDGLYEIIDRHALRR